MIASNSALASLGTVISNMIPDVIYEFWFYAGSVAICTHVLLLLKRNT